MLAAMLGLPMPGGAGELSPMEQRGRRIYFEGIGGSSTLRARVGRDGMSLPASAVPCATCHGADGTGRPESGIFPPNITWLHLTKPYGHRHRDGRLRPPYSASSFFAAVRTGLDPGGHRLDWSMPRFSFDDDDAAALVAFLGRLGGADLDPGIGSAAVRLGLVLSGDNRLAALGDAMARLLYAYFAEVNESGGIFGRRVELAVARADGATGVRGALEMLIDRERVFALVAPIIAGAEDEFTAVVESERVPVIGPVTLFRQPGQDVIGQSFFLTSDIEDQARALLAVAARDIEPPGPIGLATPDAPRYAQAGEAVEIAASERGLTVVRIAGRDARQPATAAEAMPAALLYLGPPAGLAELVAAAQRLARAPAIYATGSALDRRFFDAPVLAGIRLYAAFPSLQSDVTETGLAELRRLAARSGATIEADAVQLGGLVAAKLFVEAARRAGRSLTRASLVAQLETVRDFESGLVRPISFGPARRVGVRGVHVVRVDPAARKLADPIWVTVE